MRLFALALLSVALLPGVAASEVLYKSLPWLVEAPFRPVGFSCGLSAVFSDGRILAASFEVADIARGPEGLLGQVSASFPAVHFPQGAATLTIVAGEGASAETFGWHATRMGDSSGDFVVANFPMQEPGFTRFILLFTTGVPIHYSSDISGPVEMLVPPDAQAQQALFQCLSDAIVKLGG